MTDDDFQRKADFLLNQQAQTEARLGRLEDIVTRLADASLRRITRLEDSMTALLDAQIRAEDNVSALAGNVSALTDNVSALSGKMDILSEKMTELAQAQAHTDRKLDALIDIIREDRNGESLK
jgi:phage shock protein A